MRELLEVAFAAVGLDWRNHVEIDPKLIRPAEVDYLCGDATKVRQRLGWEPTVGFQQLIEMMVTADLKLVQSSLPAVVTATA